MNNSLDPFAPCGVEVSSTLLVVALCTDGHTERREFPNTPPKVIKRGCAFWNVPRARCASVWSRRGSTAWIWP
jgi:hypothetical protein